MAFKPIQIVINAKDNASAVLGRLGGQVKALGVAVGAYFGIKAFAGGVQSAAEFEAAMSRVKAATDGAAEEMQALTQAAQNAGSNTKYTSVEAAGALENLAKAGLSAGDSIKALPAVLALAQAGDVELATASEYVTKAVMGMGLAFDDAGRVADVLAKGANATNTSVEGLAQALSYAAPVANSLGVSLESTVAIIGKFADAGIDASRAGTALNSIMSQFANPASKFRQELGAAGIVTTDFDKAIRQLAASGPAGEKAINAVGMEAGPALRALLNQGMGALDGLTESLRNAQGSAAAAAKTMSDNLQGALTGLGSVWDSVVVALNTPVLPVLKQGVEDLTASLRRLVDDGTVARMGTVLATAFDSGIKGVQAFLGALNVDQIILRLQVMASEVGEAFQRVTTFATNAGNAVRMAWGVMTAGTSAVMAIIYKVGEAFAGVASNIQSGVAVIMDGLSRITFGSVSASFKAAAEEMRLSAEATWASSQALAAKANESFNAMAEGAELARDGWSGLTGAVGQTSKALPALGQTVQEVAAQIEASGQAAAKAQAALEAKAESDRKAAESVKRLRQEYEELIQSGNLQEAAKRLIEIDRAQQQLSKSGEKAADAAALIDQAYKNLGLSSNTALKEAADAARQSFETLAKDGTQPPQRIAEAWKVMAERVIAANAGVAPSWLKAQAGAQGYEIAMDKAGQATLRLKDANDKVADSHDRAARSIRGHITELERLNAQKEREIAVQEKANQLKERELELYRQKWNIDKEGYSLNTAGQRQSMTALSRTAVLQMAKQQGLEDAKALQIVDSFGDQYERRPGLLGGIQGGVSVDAVNKAIADAVLAQTRSKVAAAGAQPTQSAPQTNTAQQMVQTHRHEISIGGRDLGAIQTDAAGSSVLQSLMGELERSARTTGASF